MTYFFVLIMLWSLPWNPIYFPELHGVDFAFDCSPNLELGAYLRGTDTIIVCPLALETGQLRRVVIHEAQHRFQWAEHLSSRPGGWPAFEDAVLLEMETGDYTEKQQRAVRIRVGLAASVPWANELHAELPIILGLHMPASLQPWYPWLRFAS